MVAFTILAGGYDVFVATYLFVSDTCSLSLLSKSPTGLNPSWLSSHPTNKSILYAVNEVDGGNGAVQSFTVDSRGKLSEPIDTILSGGNLPAFVTALSTGQVAVMNYDSGNGRILPTTSSPTIFDNSAPLLTFPPPPGGVSHPHMVLEYNKEVLVPDLGGDTIWRLGQSTSSKDFTIHGSIPQPKGSGPRHIALFGDYLYTLHETASTLTVQIIPAAPNGTTPLVASASIIPPNPPQGSMFAAAEILIPKPTKKFPVPYIYVSNRNLGVQDPRGDAIAIFEHVHRGTPSQTLRLVKHVFTGLDQIRGMEFGPLDRGGEEFLAASGVAGSAGVIILQRTDGGRNMKVVARNLDVPTRSTFVWL